MKRYGLHVLTMVILLCLISGLVFAQDATAEPTAAATLPPDMETALVPCGDGVTGACDLIATKAEDIVGVWKQYLVGPRFQCSGRDGLHSVQCRWHFRYRRQYRKHHQDRYQGYPLARSL